MLPSYNVGMSYSETFCTREASDNNFSDDQIVQFIVKCTANVYS